MPSRHRNRLHRIRLEAISGGYEVYQGRVKLGVIRSALEPSGRVAFVLGCDRRRHPRTYRGRQLAAQALVVLSELATRARRNHMQPESIILNAWLARPPASVKTVRRVGIGGRQE